MQYAVKAVVLSTTCWKDRTGVPGGGILQLLLASISVFFFFFLFYLKHYYLLTNSRMYTNNLFSPLPELKSVPVDS